MAVRPSERSESAAMADLLRRQVERWSRGPSAWASKEFVADTFDMPGMDPANDYWSVDLEGRLVGGIAVVAVPPYSEVMGYSMVDPDLTAGDAAEVHAALVDRADLVARRYAARAEPGVEPRLVLTVAEANPLRAYLAANGFGYLRSYWGMRRDVTPNEEIPPLPDGFRARPVDPDADLDAVASVVTAFEDHHGDQVFSAEQMRHFMAGPGARPDLSRIAEDAEGPCSMTLCSIDSDGGRVDIVATLRRARGRGLATALLRTSFGLLARAGCEVVRLTVDADNPTGALGVYQRAGMTQESENQLWARPLSRA
ncbi:MAG TPA: GNAT family N-acetyltransferase [Actinomycetes bacterium]|nr:GNAT family N-acetyltransferase [Actinomycetes bacterium]